MRVTIRGTGYPADLPADLPELFRDGVAKSRRHGMPHEVEAASAYFALRAMELRGLADTAGGRREIVLALLRRRESCGGFWTHDHREHRKGGSGLRSTAAAIRVLADAAAEGLLDDPAVVADSLRTQLTHSEALENGGRWYLHDTAEAADFPMPPPRGLRPSRVWGSGERNGLVLNTHLDTLATVLLVLRAAPPPRDADRAELLDAVHAGLRALDLVLAPGRGRRRAVFHRVDGRARARLFRRGGDPAGLSRRYFKRIRPRLKARYPGLRFADGYLDRDVGYEGLAFRYHVLNLLDLTRLATALDRDGIEPDAAALCREVAGDALVYAFATPYREFVEASIREGKGWPIGLCEALAANFRTGRLIDETWLRRYAEIRRDLAPSAAVLGYEPSYLEPETAETRERIRRLGLIHDRADAHPLPDGRLLVIDTVAEPPFRFEG